MLSVLDFLKDYWWIILLVIVGIIAIIFFIKHLAECITILAIVGLGILFFVLNQNISLGFSENMTCKTIESNYKQEEYNKIDCGDYTVYIKKTNEDGDIKSVDCNMFVVKKFWFLYWQKSSYNCNGSIDLNSNLFNDIYYEYSVYRVNEEYFVNLSIIRNLLNVGSITEVGLLTPTFYQSDNNVLEPIERYGLYTYKFSSEPQAFSIDGIYNEKITLKEANQSE